MQSLLLPLLTILVFLQPHRVDGKPVEPWLKNGYKELVTRKRSDATYEVRGTTRFHLLRNNAHARTRGTHTQRTTPQHPTPVSDLPPESPHLIPTHPLCTHLHTYTYTHATIASSPSRLYNLIHPPGRAVPTQDRGLLDSGSIGLGMKPEVQRTSDLYSTCFSGLNFIGCECTTCKDLWLGASFKTLGAGAEWHFDAYQPDAGTGYCIECCDNMRNRQQIMETWEMGCPLDPQNDQVGCWLCNVKLSTLEEV